MFIYDYKHITRSIVLMYRVFCIKKIVLKKFGIAYFWAKFQALGLNLMLYKLKLQSHIILSDIRGICLIWELRYLTVLEATPVNDSNDDLTCHYARKDEIIF